MIEEHESIKEYRGPKRQFRIFLSIAIIFSFILGFTLMKRESVPTGLVISGINSVGLLGWLLLMFSIILALLLLFKSKK